MIRFSLTDIGVHIMSVAALIASSRRAGGCTLDTCIKVMVEKAPFKAPKGTNAARMITLPLVPGKSRGCTQRQMSGTRSSRAAHTRAQALPVSKRCVVKGEQHPRE